MGLLTRDYETAPCTVEVSHRFEALHAHVRFDNGAVVHPGDDRAGPGAAGHGALRRVVIEEKRVARITRASALERLWTRATGDFEFMELCEFSFSEEATHERAPLKHTADATTAEEVSPSRRSGRPRQRKRHRARHAGHAAHAAVLHHRFRRARRDRRLLVRADWDELLAQMKSDPNKGHFKKTADWDQVDWDGMEPGLKKEFLDFLISSCTAEFSGCVLYKEMKRRGIEQGHLRAVQLHVPRRGAPCGLHQRRAARGGGVGEPGLPDEGQEVHLLPAQVHLLRHLPVAKRSATPATSRSTATSRRTPNTGSTRSSSGSANGATTSSATARPSRC
jgi:hypothetical protein